jgi:orotidine-5'-phosphate decarboxylase
MLKLQPAKTDDFTNCLSNCQAANDSLLCVGLDPDMAKLPPHLGKDDDPVLTYLTAIVRATASYACAYKPNFKFFLAMGPEGLEVLEDLVESIRGFAPGVPIIIDSKANDIGLSVEKESAYIFDTLKADAITANPYLGREALAPLLERQDKGVILLCRTSNPGAHEFQELDVVGPGGEVMKLYELVASNVRKDWNGNGNVGLVVGATRPEQLARVRHIVGNDIPILAPGIGTQGGDLEATVRAGINSHGLGLLVNVSSGISSASSGEDFAQKAKERAAHYRDAINRIRGE